MNEREHIAHLILPWIGPTERYSIGMTASARESALRAADELIEHGYRHRPAETFQQAADAVMDDGPVTEEGDDV